MSNEALNKFKKTPEEILGNRVLPPPARKINPDGTSSPKRIGYGQGSPKKGYRPLYETPEALQYAAELYFQRIELTEQKPTVPDLVLALGFANRCSLYDYKKRGEDFADVIDAATTRIEAWTNRYLLEGGTVTAGALATLKNNHGWAEKSENTTTIGMSGSLQDLVQALQGRVLRPVLETRAEVIEEAEFTEELVQDTVQLEKIPQRKPRFGDELAERIKVEYLEKRALQKQFKKLVPKDEFSDLI